MTSPDRAALADELLPCPICGSSNVCTFEEQEGLFTVSCENDDCIFGVIVHGGTLKEAIERWNTRSPSPYSGAAGEAKIPVMVPDKNSASGFRVEWLNVTPTTLPRDVERETRAKLAPGPWKIEPHRDNPYNCHVADANGHNVLTNCGRAFAEWLIEAERALPSIPSREDPK